MSVLRDKIAAVPFAKTAYRSLVKCMVCSGAPRLWRALSGRRHVILTFHRVRPVGQPADPFDTCPSVSVEVFRQVLEYVSGRYAVLPLREICDGYTGETPALAVTFDDGWRDNYDMAFPVLRELGIPATVFVTTGKIGSCELFWQEILGQMFRRASAAPRDDAAHRLRRIIGMRDTRPLTPELYRHTVIRWKRHKQAECLSRLRDTGWAPDGVGHSREFLSADEIREMAAAGITFGSHTVSHRILPRYSRPEIERELTESKATLESLLGCTIDMLAYPDGQYTPEVVDCARAAGYRIACTTRSRRLSRENDRLRLPRLEVPHDPLDDVCEFDGVRLNSKPHAGLAADKAAIGSEPQQSNSRETSSEMLAPSCLARSEVPVSALSAVRKTKILFLVDDFVGPEGGTEQHLLFLQRELPRDKFELHFGVLTGLQRISSDDFPVRPVMLGAGTRHGPMGAFHRLHRLAQLIKAVDADVVHAFCRRSELDAILATKWAGRGKVLGIRRNIGYWHNWLSRWTARMVGALGAEYAANCEAAREFAAKVEWISPERTTVIQNPVSAKRLAEGLAIVPSRETLGIVDGEQVVGMVATVRPIKDYATYLHAARLVLDKHPRTRFLAIGLQEPDYTLRMRRLAHDLGIDGQVSWVGPIPNPISVLPLIDVGVLSSQSEAFSNAVLEYAAAGVATVATDVGGTREIIDDGVTGFIVRPQSPEVMAERIGRLLTDRELRTALGENARRKTQMVFSEERVLREYSALYRRLSHGTPA